MNWFVFWLFLAFIAAPMLGAFIAVGGEEERED